MTYARTRAMLAQAEESLSVPRTNLDALLGYADAMIELQLMDEKIVALAEAIIRRQKWDALRKENHASQIRQS